jgi:hypothetical protein
MKVVLASVGSHTASCRRLGIADMCCSITGEANTTYAGRFRKQTRLEQPCGQARAESLSKACMVACCRMQHWSNSAGLAVSEWVVALVSATTELRSTAGPAKGVVLGAISEDLHIRRAVVERSRRLTTISWSEVAVQGCYH